MRRILSFVLISLFLISASAHAFDGLRKGFVLGGGAGFSPYASWSVDVLDKTIDESKAAVGAQIIIGYAWDEMNMLVCEFNGVGYNSDFFLGTTEYPYNFYQLSITQMFIGPTWYHYFGPVGKSPFTMVGLGGYGFEIERIGDNDPGGGIIVGAGFEFTRHVQVGIYAGGGKTTVGPLDFKHGQISVLISGVAF